MLFSVLLIPAVPFTDFFQQLLFQERAFLLNPYQNLILANKPV